MSTSVFPRLLLLLALIFRPISGATDTINGDEVIREGEFLVSSFGKFALGFFTPGNRKSNHRYVGIWFNNITETTVVWVANRESPLTDNSSTLKLIAPGILILQNSTNATVWASTSAASAQNPTAQLLDSGNLVVRDAGNDSNVMWQSFDHPTDTYLPGMDLGWNLLTGKENYLTSWKRKDDPSAGDFSFHLDLTGYPQLVIKRGSAIHSRNGPWNGIRFPGPPNPGQDPTYQLTFVMDETKVYYRSDLTDRSFISRYTLNQSGKAQRWTWTRGWGIYFSVPADICDDYGICGAYGRCDVASSPSCNCLDHRFVPRDPAGWVRADWTRGCVRRTNLSCQGDSFVRYSGIKLPDARRSWHDSAMTLDECRAECLRNCSCTAYTQLDIKTKTGCLIWFQELIDIRTLSQDGQVFYVRVASSEADHAESGGKKRVVLIATLVSATGVVLLVLAASLYMWQSKRKNHKMITGEGKNRGGDENQSDLPFWELSVILKATNHFSNSHKLGEGGFGPVYKVNLIT